MNGEADKDFNYQVNLDGTRSDTKISDPSILAEARIKYKEASKGKRSSRDIKNLQYLRVKYPESTWKTKKTITDFTEDLKNDKIVQKKFTPDYDF